MSNNNAEISRGMFRCHGLKKKKSLQFMTFFSSASLMRTHTPHFASIHCVSRYNTVTVCQIKSLRISNSVAPSNKLPFITSKWKDKEYGKVKKKGKKMLSLKTGGVTTVHFPPVRNVWDWLDWKRSFHCFLIFFFCCFAFIVWRLPFFATPSLFQTRIQLCRVLSGSKSHAVQWQTVALSRWK